MNKRILFPLFTVTLVVSLCISNPVYACVCRGAQQPPCVAFRESTAVFAGEVADIAKAPFQDGETFHHLLINFSVEQSYKGVSTPQATVATITGTDCDFDFQKGERYFVYAYSDYKYHRLVTGVCTRTKRLSYAKEDIDYSQRANSSTRQTVLLGADESFSSPLKGSEVVVEGYGRKYKAIADDRGAFSIDLAQPGKYKVTVIGSSGGTFLNHIDSWRVFSIEGRPAVEFWRELKEGECDFVDFSQYLTVRKR